MKFQVFDNTAASREGTLQSGDEITGVNQINVKGKSKQEVAQLIQRSEVSTVRTMFHRAYISFNAEKKYSGYVVRLQGSGKKQI